MDEVGPMRSSLGMCSLVPSGRGGGGGKGAGVRIEDT